MDRKQRLARQRRQLRLAIAVAVLILVLLIALLLWLGSKDNLAGAWEFGDTFFEFNGRGKGVWMQGDEVERFSYEIHGTELTLDFRRENLPDATYNFYTEAEFLVLTDPMGNQIALSRTKG